MLWKCANCKTVNDYAMNPSFCQKCNFSITETFSPPVPAPAVDLSVPSCRTKAYFVAESQKVTGMCRIMPTELQSMFLRAKLTDTNTVLLSEEQPFTREMFGYDAGIRDKYGTLSREEKAVLRKSNFALNQAYLHSKKPEPNPYIDALDDAVTMDEIFDKIMRDKRFETKNFGIVYRALPEGIENAAVICGGNLGRFTSTSVRKNYADWWGTKPKFEQTMPNDDAFLVTIIIPPNTTSIIPLLLFGDAETIGLNIGKPKLGDPMELKTKQYEVLLHAEGKLIDTGYSDTTGYRIMVYLGPEHSALFSAPLETILSLDDGKGTNVKGLIESAAISRLGNSAYHAGKTRKRYKRTKRKRTKK